MPFLRNSRRNLRIATEYEVINRVFEKYMGSGELFFRSEFSAFPIELLHRTEDNILVFQSPEPIEGDRISLFSIVRERFIDFECEDVAPAGPHYPGESYQARIVRCFVAMDKRVHKRIEFADSRPLATGLTTVKVRELQKDFMKSLSVKMIVEEFLHRFEGVDYRKVSFPDDKDLSPPVRFVMASGKRIHIDKLSDTASFFSDNRELFDESRFQDIEDELRRWFQGNAPSLHSIMVVPVTYRPILGSPFPTGYLTLANKERSIDAALVEAVDAVMNDLSEKIRNGNLVDSTTTAQILDVSAGGARILLSDAQIIERLLRQDVVYFTMNFRDDHPLLISGKPVYAYQGDEGTCRIGVDFNGSRFGPSIESVLPIHVRHFLSRASLNGGAN